MKTHGSKVLNLQSICKRATIKIPPNTYRGDPSEQELADRIEALLDKHGLSRKAGEREIMKTKSRLQTERELEGEWSACSLLPVTPHAVQPGQSRRAYVAMSHSHLCGHVDIGSCLKCMLQ